MAEAWNGVPVKLNKKSMLKSKISIGLLFEEGVSYYKPPLLIKYRGLGSSSDKGRQSPQFCRVRIEDWRARQESQRK